MATIKDVAKMAGVSVCTVSRAIAGKGYIGQETYDRAVSYTHLDVYKRQVVAFVYAKKHKYPVSGMVPAAQAVKVTLEALPSLLLIVIVIGGIVGGIFTATEGAGICVLYCLILSLCYRSLTVNSFMKILVNSACTSGIILFLISASSAMSFVMAYSGIPAAISSAIMAVSSNKYVVLLLMNVILLIVGMFMDITPAILILSLIHI